MEENEDTLYGYMEDIYNIFLDERGLTQTNIKELIGNRLTDISVIAQGEELRFSIIDKESGQELIMLNSIKASCVKEQQKEVRNEAFKAGIIATVLYDKLVGDNEGDNPSRAKEPFWFENVAKKLVE